ncbi:GntR family transcriptional regulator [Paenarthrobacter ureafaciens]|uniref:GntR family transcriptional regulator n=1 Tax=Paenarthrobacter ureafaciens TaxID=37931 RepID=UPI001FB217FA|nr:GntR family transcriptional regulator [Paenarthrobacter ureafaciens]UOD81684.1 GntR family transcriptional regulator [Paenarthrobacter ureafaciens]WNZ05176.1 GntR family transcriptional regulator [Paenarthrobacter ureafaciens]
MSSMQQIDHGQSLTVQVTNMLRAAITSGEMGPEEHFSAIGLAEKLGVSRTPVREALQLLEKEGIVRIEKNRGVRVLQMSLDEIVQIFQIRIILEPPAAARAAEVATDEDLANFRTLHGRILEAAAREDGPGTLQADKDFHLFLMELAGNPRLLALDGELRNMVLAHGLVTIPSARSSQDLANDRKDILAALERRDPRAAAGAVRDHVTRTAHLLISGVCARTPGLSADEYLSQLEQLTRFSR